MFSWNLLRYFVQFSKNSNSKSFSEFRNFTFTYMIQIRRNWRRFKRIASLTDYRSPFYLCLSLSVPRRSKVENVNVANNSNLAGWSSTTHRVLHARRCREFKRAEDLSLSLSLQRS